MKIKYYENDLPENTLLGDIIAIDTETMGLNPSRDKLCLIQMSSGNGICHLIKILDLRKKPKNILKLLKNNKITKIFHYARFDVAIIKHAFKIDIKNIYCTKIASKLVRTYTDKHGLKELCKEMLNVDLNKSSQSSDWSIRELSKEQLKYASHDVIYLFRLKEKLEEMIAREDRQELLQKSFDFLPIRVKLDLAGWHDTDIFSH